MAHYGIQAHVAAKTASKRSPGLEKAVLEWIFSVVEEPMPEGAVYEETLKDGVLLCKLVNKVKPGAIDKVSWEIIIQIRNWKKCLPEKSSLLYFHHHH